MRPELPLYEEEESGIMHRSSAFWRCSVSPDQVVLGVVTFAERIFVFAPCNSDDDISKEKEVVGVVTNPRKLSQVVASARNETNTETFLEVKFARMHCPFRILLVIMARSQIESIPLTSEFFIVTLIPVFDVVSLPFPMLPQCRRGQE